MHKGSPSPPTDMQFSAPSKSGSKGVGARACMQSVRDDDVAGSGGAKEYTRGERTVEHDGVHSSDLLEEGDEEGCHGLLVVAPAVQRGDRGPERLLARRLGIPLNVHELLLNVMALRAHLHQHLRARQRQRRQRPVNITNRVQRGRDGTATLREMRQPPEATLPQTEQKPHMRMSQAVADIHCSPQGGAWLRCKAWTCVPLHHISVWSYVQYISVGSKQVAERRLSPPRPWRGCLGRAPAPSWGCPGRGRPRW